MLFVVLKVLKRLWKLINMKKLILCNMIPHVRRHKKSSGTKFAERGGKRFAAGVKAQDKEFKARR